MDIDNVGVRDYAVADRDGCLNVFDSNVPDWFMTSERAAFEGFLDDLPGPYLVLRNESDRIVACGGYAVTPGTTVADFCWGMVSGERHGMGLGRRLAEVRLDRIRTDPGVTAVALRTSHLTRGFYEKLGFVTERVVPEGIGPGLDECWMRLELAAQRSVFTIG